MGYLGTAWRGARNVWAKIKAGENWYAENISEPMLAELEGAQNGDLPGEYGDRPSSWEENVTPTVKRRSDAAIQRAAEQYTDALDELEKAEDKRTGLAERFITHFPGGEIENSNVRMVTHVTSREGQIGPAEPRPEKGEFDSWIKSAWPAFEQSESVEEFRRRVLSKSRDHESSFDEDLFICWEEQLEMDDWDEVLWGQYNQEYLTRYMNNLRRLGQAKDDIRTRASELDRLIEVKI